MKLQKILSNFQKLHPKEIDLSLDRIKNLCEKLGNPQKKIKAISIVGTNGKNSTIQAAYSILKEANFECNVYTSPHIQKINERFVFNDEEISDDSLCKLLTEVENINNIIDKYIQNELKKQERTEARKLKKQQEKINNNDSSDDEIKSILSNKSSNKSNKRSNKRSNRRK